MKSWSRFCWWFRHCDMFYMHYKSDLGPEIFLKKLPRGADAYVRACSKCGRKFSDFDVF